MLLLRWSLRLFSTWLLSRKKSLMRLTQRYGGQLNKPVIEKKKHPLETKDFLQISSVKLLGGYRKLVSQGQCRCYKRNVPSLCTWNCLFFSCGIQWEYHNYHVLISERGRIITCMSCLSYRFNLHHTGFSMKFSKIQIFFKHTKGDFKPLVWK